MTSLQRPMLRLVTSRAWGDINMQTELSESVNERIHELFSADHDEGTHNKIDAESSVERPPTLCLLGTADWVATSP